MRRRRAGARPGAAAGRVLGAAGLAGLVGLAAAVGAAPAGAADGPGAPSGPGVTSADFSLSVSVAGGTTPIQVTGTGQIDFTHDDGTLSATVTGLPTTGTGASGGSGVQLVFAGGTLYASVPMLSGLLGSKPWVSFAVPSADSAGISKGFARAADDLAHAATIVSQLEADGATGHPLAPTTIDGVPATGTEVDVNVAQAVAALPGLPSGTAQKALGALGSTVPLSVWADGSGRLLGISATLSTDLAMLGSATVTVTVDITGYGSPVSVSAPDPAETSPLPAGLLRQLTALGSHRGPGRHAEADAIGRLGATRPGA